MRNRKVPFLRTKTKVKQSQIDKIKADGLASDTLLTSDEFKFLIDYIEESKQYILDTHAKQSLYDLEEQHTVGDKIRKIFIPAQKEYNLMAGEYRFANKIINHLRSNVELAKELTEKIKAGEVEVINE